VPLHSAIVQSKAVKLARTLAPKAVSTAAMTTSGPVGPSKVCAQLPDGAVASAKFEAGQVLLPELAPWLPDLETASQPSTYGKIFWPTK
jgi:hypothetical protein